MYILTIIIQRGREGERERERWLQLMRAYNTYIA